VEIIFYDETGADQTRFKGLINDDATRLDFDKNLIRFKVLSLDSIFRQVSVPAGAIVAGDLFSTAIKKILNVPEITSTLTYSAANVTVNLDLTIDDGDVFSAIPAKEALDLLLLASNSILFVDNTDTIYVKARRESLNQFNLYGIGDQYGREDIVTIKEYNNGLQRAFSSIKVNENTVATSEAYVAEYGFRQKDLTLDFITTLAKEEEIAARLLDEFKVPKPEMEITVLSRAVEGIEILDMVSILSDYRMIPSDGGNLPLRGSAIRGAAIRPKTIGAYRILPKMKWKVISIDEDPAKFTTALKLRQTGTETHDGVFV
jgi:hypothetical protein